MDLTKSTDDQLKIQAYDALVTIKDAQSKLNVRVESEQTRLDIAARELDDIDDEFTKRIDAKKLDI